MKALLAMLLVVGLLLSSGMVLAQDRGMMNGGNWMGEYGGMGGYGWILVSILLVAMVAALGVWVAKRKGL